MFGEPYFATRQRLTDLIRAIAQLATETATDLGDSLPLTGIEGSLGTPFLFVVSGEVNAGKSSLLNGLFGRDLCPIHLLPKSSHIHWYQYGTPARDVEISAQLEKRYRPSDFLLGFNLVDTPGTHPTGHESSEITTHFFPSADLILFVFAVNNPWAATTWNCLSELSPQMLSRAVLIIQQADQRDSVDIRVILGHMASLALKRLGHVPPLFAVSGKMALEAKRRQPIAHDSLKASGYPELENFIAKYICESPERIATLNRWRGQAATALRQIEDHIEDQSLTLNHQGRFLDTIEREIDEIRERFVLQLPRHLEGVAEVFQTEAVWVSKRLRRRLSVIPSFFRLLVGDRTGPAVEALFVERLQAAVEAVAGKDGDQVVEFCYNHWSALGDRVKDAMAIDLGSSEPLDATLSTAKKSFVQRLGRAARQGIGNLKVRNQLDKELRHRNLALKSFIFTTLILTTCGATCGALAMPWFAATLCSLAVLFLISGILVAWGTRKAIAAEFQRRLLDTCGGFANTLRADYEEALRIVFQDYATSLTAVRTHLAREKQAIEPHLKRWQALFLTLKAIEQEL